MTAFIDSFTTQQLVPPWISKGARLWSFVIEVPARCIQDYLDTHFNAPGPDQAPYRYTAITEMPFGMLTFADHADFSSEVLGAGWNTLRHREVHWSVPAVRQRITPDNLLVDREIVSVQPFAFDDNSSVLLAGREILGTEFEMGTIVVEEGATAGNLHIDVAVQGFETFAPASRGRLVPVLHARLAGGNAPTPADAGMLAGLTEIRAFAGKADPAANNPGAFALPTTFEINTLKQFRDVFDMRFAAYRALIATRTTHSAWQDVKVYPGDNASLDFMWTDSLKEKFVQLFGLSESERDTWPRGHPDRADGAPDTSGPDANGIDWNLPHTAIPVAFAVSYTADVRYEVTDTLHVYGQPGAF